MKRSTSLFFLLILFSLQAFGTRSVVYNITSLMTDPDGTLPLMAGKSVRLRTAVTAGAQLLFEDLVPTANWGHPAILRVISKEGQLLQEVRTNLPPLNFRNDLPVVEGEAPMPSNRVEFKINNLEGLFKVKDPQNYYALLINGQADQRHWNDFSFLYRVLTQIYGYNRANIFVADSHFKDSSPDLDGDGTPDIQYASTLAGVRELMAKLKTDLNAQTHLVIAVDDHGNTEGGESTIVLADGELKASDFSKMLKDVPAGKVLSIFEQCFSGGYVRPTVSSSRVAMAASTNNEFSYASMDLNFDEFIYHVITAFAKQTHDGRLVSTDLNNDGKLSAQEAFTYAVGAEKRPESPLLEATNNSGNSALIGLGF